jgi:EAL domain-containing protein (putative c-di-GMP-specific phosphodiesterase class I)
VLVVDDEPSIRTALSRLLQQDGHLVDTAGSAEEALERFRAGGFDVVVSDIVLPGMDGIELMRQIRGTDADVPVIVVTGGPRLETAIEAVRFGALRYLVKPLEPTELKSVVREAVSLQTVARIKRQALALLDESHRYMGDRAALEVAFVRTLGSVEMFFQPIVRWSSRELWAYEALMRSFEPELPTPDAVIDAAERLGWVERMSRALRALSAAAVNALPEESLLFVNLHALDLRDPDLLDAHTPLAAVAGRVVLEITERQSLGDLDQVRSNVGRLKDRGFRVAIDDFGAGHAGLTSFAVLEPDIIKLDMGLVRDIDRIDTKRKLVASMIGVCRDLGVQIIAEGVERRGELDALVDLGCDVFQGYLFARPGRAFPAVDWPG